MGPSRRQKRGLAVGKTKRGKGTKIMAIADASGIPVAAHIESASPHEVKLVDATTVALPDMLRISLLATKPMTATVWISDCLMSVMSK
jgi:hypothetical protein